MIRAGEAYNISLLHDCTGKQLEEIEECIRRAAMNGLYQCIYPGLLTEGAQAELSLNEFETNAMFDNGLWYTVISWEL